MSAPKAKQIVVLRGSPRANGNSDQMADRFCETALAQGCAVNDYALRDLSFVPFGEVPDDHQDGLSDALNKIYDADIVVLSTPIYLCNMSGLLKGALDRFFDFLKSDYLTNPQPSKLSPGKQLVLLQTQGEPAARYGNLLEQYGPALDKLGFAERHMVRACGVRDIGDILSHADALAQVDALAKSLTTA
ncbi:flavodoxin family protein [Maritalea myrionectae]|uniref:flavodoxin family protein n=1 Tax=Maritalea myrionectae TaxID=454601 RepID=UPI00040DE5EA|nr:NAD(P)H-dependent oxidoreductase [Maritalea myrionectae]